MKSWRNDLSTKVILMVAALLILSNSALCVVSISRTRVAIRKAIQQRMLDIANCAAGSLDGDMLDRLTIDNIGSDDYNTIFNTLAVFRDNVELEYVYGIKDEGDGRFTFTVDPTIADPAPFGNEVTYTSALAAAASGTAAVDNVPYEDAWGRFYSAYSPVFDSSGKVAGIIAADFSVAWFESQLSEQTRATLLREIAVLIVTLVFAAALTLLTVRPFVRQQEQLVEENEQLLMQVVQTLADAIDAKDTYTNGHSGRVATYAREIASRYGYDDKALDEIYMMGLLHDVGKIGVPDEIINKPSRLTAEEYERVKAHSVVGAHILENITSMPKLSEGARWHHERYGGGGYPDNLSKQSIPEAERIIAVADAYDAMTSNRSYRHAMPQSRVREQIANGRGTQFDPVFADIMLEMIDEDTGYQMRDTGEQR